MPLAKLQLPALVLEIQSVMPIGSAECKLTTAYVGDIHKTEGVTHSNLKCE